MSNIVPQKHNFELAKQQIQEFSQRLPADPKFTEVATEGEWFGWLGTSHDVTGEELNTVVSEVSDSFLSINKSLKEVISEFGEVYNALEHLDSEYIAGILGSLEAAKEASEEALSAQLENAVTIEGLKRTVEALQKFKNEVDNKFTALGCTSSSSASFPGVERINRLEKKLRIAFIIAGVGLATSLALAGVIFFGG